MSADSKVPRVHGKERFFVALVLVLSIVAVLPLPPYDEHWKYRWVRGLLETFFRLGRALQREWLAS